MIENEQQWNDLEQPSVSWSKMAIIIGAVLIGVVIIIGAVWLVRSWRQETRMIETTTEQIMNGLAGPLDDCETAIDPEACRNYLVAVAAVDNELATMCELMSDPAQAECWEFAARQANDAEICSLIVEETAGQSCQDAIKMKELVAKKDYLGCLDLFDLERQTECQKRIEPYLWSINQCAEYGIAQVYCDDYQIALTAKETGNSDLCSGLQLEIVGDCLEMVQMVGVGLDSDNDGLTDDQEAAWKTNPVDPDSDDDGYDDGTEINAGYNPLGPGNL